MNTKLAFYVSGNSGRLIKFVNQASDEVLEAIKIIVSDRPVDEKLQTCLEEKKLKCEALDYKIIPGKGNTEKNLFLSDWMLGKFRKYHIDYCFSFGSHILMGELLRAYRWHLINFHPAILPMYPGRKSIDQAVQHGNTFLVGNTAHFIDGGIDTGKIIMQSVIPLNAFLESGNDYDVVLDLQIEMLNKLIDIISQGKLIIENDNVRIIGADYTKSIIFPTVGGV